MQLLILRESYPSKTDASGLYTVQSPTEPVAWFVVTTGVLWRATVRTGRRVRGSTLGLYTQRTSLGVEVQLQTGKQPSWRSVPSATVELGREHTGQSPAAPTRQIPPG